ncbi:MAG: hypothetical protein Q7U53_10140 [Anaerolineaceae bacterium]|nr:hypothetical protein [Anaerolineaceae bacterium]
MLIELLGGELVVKISFENTDREFDDNIRLSFHEPCHDDTRIFRATETNLFLTSQEARKLAEILQKIADESDLSSHDSV